MAEPEAPNSAEQAGSKVKDFLTHQIGMFPVWLWGIIGVVGVGAALMARPLLSGLLGGGGNTTPSQSGSATGAGATGDTSGSTGSDTSNLDAQLNGLVAAQGNLQTLLQNLIKALTPPPKPNPTPGPGHGVAPPPKTIHVGGGDPHGPPSRNINHNAQGTYVTVAKWPNAGSTLSQIASKYGTSVANLMHLNPSITNPNVIQAGERIRVR